MPIANQETARSSFALTRILVKTLYIVCFITISALGLVSPIVAALPHEFGAFFVILNSARLLRFDELADS